MELLESTQDGERWMSMGSTVNSLSLRRMGSAASGVCALFKGPTTESRQFF